jgi:hypothetical protein
MLTERADGKCAANNRAAAFDVLSPGRLLAVSETANGLI